MTPVRTTGNTESGATRFAQWDERTAHGAIAVQNFGQPVYSPDGRFIWDGQRWVPIAVQPMQHGPPMGSVQPMTTGPRRSALLHFFASFIIIGLGTMFAGKVAKGLVLFVLGNGAAVATLVLSLSLSHACRVASGEAVCSAGYQGPSVALWIAGLALTCFLLWIYGLFDAVASTREWNREHGWPR